MEHLVKIIIWYEDDYGRRWEYESCKRTFKRDAAEILEAHIDNGYKLFYTIHNEDQDYELDYYNTI